MNDVGSQAILTVATSITSSTVSYSYSNINLFLQECFSFIQTNALLVEKPCDHGFQSPYMKYC